MKRLVRATLTVLGLAAAVGVALVCWLVFRPVAPVTVTVRNDSQKPIALASVEHERGVETAGNIARGEARTITFVAGGETSYRLRVRFADGSETRGREQYAESGYVFVETVTDSGVRTDDVSLRRY
jgi:hypothetical protein